MKTKLQVIIAVTLVIASTVGISGEYMINVPIFNDSICLWAHYIICAFSGLFGVIWLYWVGDQNDMLIRFRKDYYWSVEKNCELSAKVNELTKQMIDLKTERDQLKSKNLQLIGSNSDLIAKLAETESDKAIISDCSDMLHEEYMILKQKYFSAQGNMAQLRSKIKHYKSVKEDDTKKIRK